MYLIPRLIGVGVYTLILNIICFSINIMKEKYLSKWIKVYILLLSIMAFLYVPSEGADLYRLFPVMHIYTSMSPDALKDTMINTSTPGVPLYYYLIGKLGVDGLLPGITALLTYTLIFSILLKCYKKIESRKKDVVLILFLFMSRGLFQVTISNIRTVLAIAIVAWCIYTEIDLKRSIIKNIIFYLIAASLHVMGQFMIFLRIILLLFEKRETKIDKFMKIAFSIGSIIVTMSYGSSYVEAFLDKGERYITGGQLGEGYFYFWEALLSIISIILLLYLINRVKIYKDKSPVKNNRFVSKRILNFLSVIAIFNLGIIFFEFNLGFRLSFFIMMLNIPIGLYCLKCTEGSREYIKVKNSLLIISLIMLIISVTRGDLCSLKFF